MAFTKEITHLEKSNVKLNIIVPKDDAAAQYQDMLKEYAKNLQLPGFRKGKVPQEVIERKFADALKNDALGRIIETTLQDVFKDETLTRYEKPLPYSTPVMQEMPKFDLENDIQFSVVYDVLPEVKINKWKGFTVEFPYAEIDENDIERELKEIQERNAIVMDRDDEAAAQKNDTAAVDYFVYEEDGETPSNIERKDFVFTIGSGNNIFQFDDEIIGMKKGETKKFEKVFAGDFLENALAGKTRKVQVTLNSLKEKKLPDLDDDLAQDVDEKFNTLDDLKNSVIERLNKNIEKRLRDVKLSELLKKIMENTPVTLPESLIKAEVESRWRKIAQYYNTSVETLKQIMIPENTRDEKEKEWNETAQKALHSRMIIETLIEEQKIEVGDEETEKEIERLAGENNMEIEEFRKNYNEQSLFYLKEDIKERRIVDILLTENTLKTGKKENYLDFMKDNG